MTRFLARRLTRIAVRALVVVTAILVVASLPVVLRSEAGQVQLRPRAGISEIGAYLRGLSDGSSFTYIATHMRWSFLKEAPSYLGLSLAYASLGLGIGLLGGLALSLLLADSHRRWYAGLLYFLDSVPDFVVALLMQIMAVMLARALEFRVVRIAHAAAGHLILLPVLALGLYVFLHVLRTATSHASRLLRSDFVAFARGLGYSQTRVLVKQVLPGLLPVVRAELAGIVSNVVGAIVIAEQLFLIPGIARLLFHFGYRIDTPAFRSGYQYPLVANSLLAIGVMYVILYLGTCAVLRLISLTVHGDDHNAEATY